MKKISILAALGLLALAGCNNSDGPIGSQSVEWYMAHPKERAQQTAWCKEQSASVQLNNQACSQAGTAASKAMAGSVNDWPEIKITGEGK